MTTEDKVVLTLIRIVLSGKAEILSDSVDWSAVINKATEQGVLGVCFDALEIIKKSLSSNLSTLSSFPDIDNLMEWLGQTSYMETQYEEYKEAIKSFGEFCKTQNVPVLLMKGYGCSLNYPVPKHRPCGDIDVYLGKYKGFIEQLLKNEGVEIDYDNDHHAVFSYHGFTVESHQTIMDANSHKSNGYINQLLEQLAVESVENGKEVLGMVLPSTKFNSIHLLRHMASDFATVKTTLRHVLDWSTFISSSGLNSLKGSSHSSGGRSSSAGFNQGRADLKKAGANGVDWDFVHEVAHKAKMNRFLDAINGICVDYLGYPPEMFPVEVRDERLEQRVLNEILTCKDAVDAPTGKLSFGEKVRYGMSKTARMWRNRWKYDIVYDESLLDAFIWKARNRW